MEKYRFCSGAMSRISFNACRKNRFPSWSSPSKTSVTSRTSRMGSKESDPLSAGVLGAPDSSADLPSTRWNDVTFCSTPSSRTDRKSTRLNSSHSQISYAVFCLKKKQYQNECKHQSPHQLKVQSQSLPIRSHRVFLVFNRGDWMS